MKRLASCCFFVFIGFMPLGAAFAGSVVAGSSCDQLGTSLLSSDKKDILACLTKTEGTGQVWTALTDDGSFAKGEHCGFVTANVTYTQRYSHAGGIMGLGSDQVIASSYPCQGVTIAQQACWYCRYYSVTGCPTGFQLVFFGVSGGSEAPAFSINLTSYQYYTYYYMCVKT